MNAHIYLLRATSAFHFGIRGVGIEATSTIGHADTLWSAFCIELAQFAGRSTLLDFLRAYADGASPMLLTSAFPYGLSRPADAADSWQPPATPQPSDVVLFYPRPLAYPRGLERMPELHQDVKHVTLISQGILNAWAAGRDLSPHVGRDGRLLTIQSGEAWVTAPEYATLGGWYDQQSEDLTLWSRYDVPRVTVDRITSASTVYQAGRLGFRHGCGLWVGVVWSEEWRTIGEAVLRSLGDSGVGGERSVGHGQFELVPLGPKAFADPQPGAPFLNLALYWPINATEAQEVLGPESARYTLETRRGYMSSRQNLALPGDGKPVQGSALRRKAVHMVGEGSLLVAGARAPYGGLADVTPDLFRASGGHEVYRYGYAFPLAFGGGHHA